jgi:hypothetical protein
LISKNLSNFTATVLFKFQKFWTHHAKALVKDKKILARVPIEVDNCDTHAEQNISFINETEWYGTKFVQYRKVEFEKSFKLYHHRSVQISKILDS